LMSRSNNTPEGDPLYIITLHHERAETLFRAWTEQNRITRYQISGRRMCLYSGYDFDQFRMTWNTNWHNLSIWDNWNRRLVYL
jgi:hypothetical protein